MRHSRGHELALIVLWLASCAPHPDVPVPCTRHINRIEAFSACIPPGWVLQDTTYSFMGDIGVFALARNQAAAGVSPYISIQDWSSKHRTGWPEATTTLVEQVPPGGVVLMFWHLRGGPVPLCGFSRDTVGDSLDAFVDSLRLETSSPLHIRFAKWGDVWNIDVLARGVTSVDRQQIRELLRSIVFEPTPVISKEQAAQLAYRALPADARARAGSSRGAGLDVLVTEVNGVFDVLFRPCKGCEDDPGAGSASEDAGWSYRVHTDGTVEATKSRERTG